MLMANLVLLALPILEVDLVQRPVPVDSVHRTTQGADLSVQLPRRRHLDNLSQLRQEALAQVGASLAHRSLPPAGCSVSQTTRLMLQLEAVYLVLLETRVDLALAEAVSVVVVVVVVAYLAVIATLPRKISSQSP